MLELDAPAIHPARSGNTGCFSAHTPGDAPTCVLRHQLSSERRIVLLLQPLHERQALSIRVRGCGQPARRRRTSCAHAARLRRPSCAPCWQWTNVTFLRARNIASTRERAGSRAIRAAARGDNHPMFQRKLTASIQYYEYGFTHNNIDRVGVTAARGAREATGEAAVAEEGAARGGNAEGATSTRARAAARAARAARAALRRARRTRHHQSHAHRSLSRAHRIQSQAHRSRSQSRPQARNTQEGKGGGQAGG